MKILKISTIIIFIFSCAMLCLGKYYNYQKDKIPPVISSESSEISVYTNYTDEDLKAGLKAFDNVDGDITSKIIVGNLSPFSSSGESTVKYVVFDKNNNVGVYERVVKFADYSSPKLSLSKPLAYKRGADIVVSDRLSVYDCIEGDISGRLRYSSPDIIQSEVGTYSLAVEATNSLGDDISVTLPINIVSHNTDREMIKLNTYLIYAEVGSDIDPYEYVVGLENSDNSLLDESNIHVTEYADLSKPGSSQYKYELRSGSSVVSVTFLTVIVE